MRRALLFLGLILLLAAGFASVAGATVYTFQPSPSDLYELPEDMYYTWGMHQAFDGPIVSANLFIKQIFNSTAEQNVLYVHLLDRDSLSVPLSVTSFSDSATNEVDRFVSSPYNSTNAPFLKLWNIPATKVNLSYDFSAANLLALNSFVAANGNFGLGLDPDCYYSNDGITLTLNTTGTPVPEPATLLLVGGGLLGVGFRRIRSIGKSK